MFRIFFSLLVLTCLTTSTTESDDPADESLRRVRLCLGSDFQFWLNLHVLCRNKGFSSNLRGCDTRRGGSMKDSSVCKSAEKKLKDCGYSCPEYGPWGAWSPCKGNCYTGYKIRFRECRDTACDGPDKMWKPCDRNDCPNGVTINPSISSSSSHSGSGGNIPWDLE